MTTGNYLKAQLTDFVESYQTYFKKTFGATVVFTIICYVIAAFFVRISVFDTTIAEKQISLLSYFFHRYSKGETYSIVDLIKSVFFLFVALFSIGLIRLKDKTLDDIEFSSTKFFRLLELKDVVYVVGMFILTALIDLILFRVEAYSAGDVSNKAFGNYFGGLIFHLRIYIPIILFALTIRVLTLADRTQVTLKRILFLYISIWLYNEFAYEISMWVRAYVFRVILIPFEKSDYFYLLESFIGIPLIAFYFLGYYSAMVTSLMLTEKSQEKDKGYPQD